jgi:lysozyme family protein
MYISFDKYGPEYKQLWDTMHIIRDTAELQRLSNKIRLSEQMYRSVGIVPWQMVAVIHVREAGEQDIGRWKCVLHNGEKIIGTGQKTRLVPAGRGPFYDWTNAAIDALRLQGFDKYTDWTVGRVLWALEPFNGYGYRNKGLRSPYLWASTNHQQLGKYIADGVFDANVMDSQIGCAALLKYLEFGGTTTQPVPHIPDTPTFPARVPPVVEQPSFIEVLMNFLKSIFKRK